MVVLPPAFRWAQSLDTVFLEVKFATRLDSPACIDLFDKKIELKNQTLLVEAMCRNDRRLLKYVEEINLFSKVAPFSRDVSPDMAKQLEEGYIKFEKYKKEYHKYRRVYEE